jgi:dipeptidyl aminopeptidase/acylaminoacyl peptidase
MARRTAELGVGVGVLVVATAVLGVYGLARGGSGSASHPRARASAAAQSTSSPVQSATAAAVPNPLTIAAMRSRPYPASTLTVTRSDGDQGGYANTVVSFVSDGLTEYALMSVPDSSRPAKGWPVIVISHGYLDPATYRTDDASYGQFIAAFARAGYAVLKPDYRGHGQSQGVAEGGYLSPVYTYDLLNLVSTLEADPRFDPGRIGLFGHSLGGYEVLRAMVISHDIRAVVFMAGVVGSLNDIFYSWPATPRPTNEPSPPIVQQQVAQSAIASNGTPQTNPGFWDSASPLNFVAASTAVVQINEDVADSAVPKLFSDHLDAALVAAGKSVEYHLYPGDDHQFISNRAAVLAQMLTFYRAHL